MQAMVAPSILQRFNPTDPDPYVDEAVAGCLAFLLAALDRPRPTTAVGSKL